MPRTIPPPTIGRPSKYDKSYPHIAYTACKRLGATNPDLAELFEVTVETVENWMNDCPIFLRAIKDGRDVYDTMWVEKSLRNRAVGYSYEERKYKTVPVKDADGELHWEEKCVERIEKQMAANVTAAMFWLQNRQSDRWKNVRHVEASVKTAGEQHHYHHEETINPEDILANVKDKGDLEQLRDILARAVAESDPVSSDTGAGGLQTRDKLPGSFH